jgi:NTE family protein
MRLTPCFLLVLAAAILVPGCAHYRDNSRLPVPLIEPVSEAFYRYSTVRHRPTKEKPFVVLAFSGGGTRAAAFAFGAMETLRDVQYSWNKRSLLDDVEIISSVSGGSFASAYYALCPECFFRDFPSEVLYRNIQGELVLRMFNPYNWVRLASPNFSRIDLAEEYYNNEIFKGKTFGDLLKRPKGTAPFLVLNATDIGIAHRFEFTQDQFDLLCSDLSKFPVSRAVAASSDFPVAFTPLTLNNYSGACPKLPTWVINGAVQGRNSDRRRVIDATAAASYREKDRKFIHLLDGGLSDNLGLRGPYQAVTSTDSLWSVMGAENRGLLSNVIMISVNAKTTKMRIWDQKSSPPGITSVLDVVMNGPMDDVSQDSVDITDGFFKQKRQLARTVNSCNKRLAETCPGAGTIPNPIVNPITADYTFVELTFDDIKDKHLRRCLQELPTTFSLPNGTVDLLRQVARDLLINSADFKEVMQKIQKGWQPDSNIKTQVDPKLVDEVCGPGPSPAVARLP